MKLKLTLALLALSTMGFSQVSLSDFTVGAAGNYTMYKGDFQKSVAGIKAEVGYGMLKKVGFTLGFTKGFAIKSPSTISSSNGIDSKQTASTIKTSISTITLQTKYRFVGSDEGNFSIYLPVGASLVMANSKEEQTEAIPAGYTATDQMETTKQSGFTMNGGLGFMYKIGAPMVFGEVGVAIPANQVNNTYVTNVIPAHYIFNVGVRFSLGQSQSE